MIGILVTFSDDSVNQKKVTLIPITSSHQVHNVSSGSIIVFSRAHPTLPSGDRGKLNLNV